MNKIGYNLLAAVHNLDLVARAEMLVNNFLSDDDGFIYVQNPDGTSIKLQSGVKFIAATGLGITNDK